MYYNEMKVLYFLEACLSNRKHNTTLERKRAMHTS